MSNVNKESDCPQDPEPTIVELSSEELLKRSLEKDLYRLDQINREYEESKKKDTKELISEIENFLRANRR